MKERATDVLDRQAVLIDPARSQTRRLDPHCMQAVVDPAVLSGGYGGVKPHTGGLWSSTYRGPDELSAWAQWCRAEEFLTGERELITFAPDDDATVWVIDSLHDLEALLLLIGRTDRLDRRCLDWGLVEVVADGVHLTEEGQWATRLTEPGLYGWDCESTLWCSWRFTDVRHEGRVKV